jgi:hypothetical protein
MMSEDIDIADDNHRRQILAFVESFRTAYNRKDIDLLAKVYSDDALIITGKVVKQTKSVENVMEDAGIFKEKIEYQTSTKKKYINYLHSIFKKNEKINVTFDKIQVVHSAECPDIYGVRLLQGWNTSNYSDTGFLFLMIDFRDGENMQVVVRTWQSGKEDGEALSEDEIFKLGDFDIKK